VNYPDRETLFWLNATLIMNVMDVVCKLRLSIYDPRQVRNGIYDAVIVAATRKATDYESD
jgi:hypothetical protein